MASSDHRKVEEKYENYMELDDSKYVMQTEVQGLQQKEVELRKLTNPSAQSAHSQGLYIRKNYFLIVFNSTCSFN